MVSLTFDERWPTLCETASGFAENTIEPDPAVLERWRSAKREYDEAEKALMKSAGLDRYVD